ncbi:MAG: sulfite exporter TauE/SafE family protein [Burkholderiaceae bacterium]
MDAFTIALLLALGAFAGFAAGLLGIGGGMLMVPFMTMLLSAQGFAAEQVIKVAIATSLTTIAFTSISSVRAHHRRGAVRWDAARALAPGILLGSLVAAQFAGALPGRLLALFFGLFLGFSALKMLGGKPPQAEGSLPSSAGMFGMGSVIGALSAVLGAGGGFLTVPFLVKRSVPMQQAVATSAACGFPIALAGAAGYVVSGWNADLPSATLGYIYLPALAAISIASVFTAPLGARVAHALPTQTLKRVFAALLLALALYMLFKAWEGR